MNRRPEPVPGFDPEIHQRRSIRLKAHDYAGPGVYFVTMCAHREFIAFAQGHPFSPPSGVSPTVGARRISPSSGATCVSPVRGIMVEEWRLGGVLRDDVFPGEFVVMPDHVHGLIRIGKGESQLGHVIGAFKAAVSRRVRRGPGGPPAQIRIWHRNYYERIVRTPEAERNIRDYIRMNPWKLVQQGVMEGRSFRMIGNPALLNRDKIALLCSRSCPADMLAAATKRARTSGPGYCFISGFHSPPERAVLATLLQSEARIICCPAWGIDTMRIPPDWLPALESNRMVILEMQDQAGDLAAAEARNRFVLDAAGKRWLPHVARGGMLARLVRRPPPRTHAPL